jgi:hypothetical protein
LLNPNPILIIIKPSWLKVDRAIIFFISISVFAPIPAISMVIIATINSGLVKPACARGVLNRMSKYTPAVTRVEECTKAETGVGAAIAAGSQAENGICALLVHAAIKTKVDRLAAAKMSVGK